MILRINRKLAINTDNIAAIQPLQLDSGEVVIRFYEGVTHHDAIIPKILEPYWYDYYTTILVEMSLGDKPIHSVTVEEQICREMGFGSDVSQQTPPTLD